MTIVHVCLIGPMTDGWSYQENMLAKYHLKQGNSVSVIASQWIYDNTGKLIKENRVKYDYCGIHMYRIPTFWGNVDTKIKLYKGIYNLLEEIKPDVIFVHGFHFLDIRQIARYAKKYNPIVYVDNHSDYSNSGTNWISKNILHGILWKHCAHVIEPFTKKFYGVLPARVDFLIDLYKLPKNKCELLVMGADDEEVERASDPTVKVAIRQKYGIAAEEFLVMTGGKIDAFKTQTLLLMDAVNSITNPKVKLIVFGSVTQDLKEEVEKRCSKRVQYIGWQRMEESYALFASADLVCFPGRHSVFWEQVAAQGIPMLCKKWDGTTHVNLGGNVEFLTQDSAKEIQNEIDNILKDPEMYKHMKSIAVEKGMQEFSYRNIARRSIEG